MINLFHLLVAVVTFVIFLLKQKCTNSPICIKSSRPLYFYGDPLYADYNAVKSNSYLVLRPRYEWSNTYKPKYKRDPQISVDNEDIDYQPLD